MIPFNLSMNMVLVAFFCFPYYFFRSLVRWALIDISSLLSSPFPSSTSPWRSPAKPFLVASLWVACGLVGLGFAITGWFADGFSEDGWRLRNLPMTEAGASLFPWNRFLRTRSGYFAMIYVAPSEASIEMITDALRTDPFAADLTLGLAQHWAAVGNPILARIVFAHFRALAPNYKLGASP